MRSTQAITILICLALDITSTLPTETTPSASCVTGKYIAGTCVNREHCVYGTAAIDFTLYQPRGFKLSCPIGQACCPPQFLVQHEDKVYVPNDGVFDFDDDD